MFKFKAGNFFNAIPALFLICALLGIHLFYDHHQEVGPDRLADVEWKVSDSLAEISVDGVMATTALNKKHGQIYCQVGDVQPGELFRLRGESCAEGIECGKRGYEIGRITFAQQDCNNRVPYNVPHAAGEREGTCGWREFELITEIQPQTRTVKLYSMNLGCKGCFKARNVTLKKIEVRGSQFKIFRVGILVLVLLGIGYIQRFQLAKRFWGWMIILSAAAIFTGVLLPRTFVSKAPKKTAMRVDRVAHKIASKTVKSQPPKNQMMEWVKKTDIDRLGHTGLFFVFGTSCAIFFLSANIPIRQYRVHYQDGKTVIKLIFSIFLFSVTAELAQVLSISRSVNIGDWVQNITGAGMGLTLFVLGHLGAHPIRRLIAKKNAR